MRYRRLDSNGDYVFGQGPSEFLVNSAAAVAQAVQTRLLLWTGEWFLDSTQGTPYFQQVLGFNTKAAYDAAIKARILGTQGVAQLLSYSSSLIGRALSVIASVQTIYSITPVMVSV